MPVTPHEMVTTSPTTAWCRVRQFLSHDSRATNTHRERERGVEMEGRLGSEAMLRSEGGRKRREATRDKKLTKQCKVLNRSINRIVVKYSNPGTGLGLRGPPCSNQEPVKQVCVDAIEGVICHPSFDVMVTVVLGYEVCVVVCGIVVPFVAFHFNSEPAGTDAVGLVVIFGIVPAH